MIYRIKLAASEDFEIIRADSDEEVFAKPTK